MTPDVRSKPGFTLIEIMTVITIIGILSTLLIVGIGHLKTSANRQQTHQLLQNCSAWWTEFDATQHYHFDPFETDAPGNVSADLASQLGAANPAGLGGDRVGSRAVLLTRCVFEEMRTSPQIKLSMEHFPSGRMLLPVSQNGDNGWTAVGQWQSGQRFIAGYGACSQTFPLPNGNTSGFKFLAITNHTASDGSYTPDQAPAPIPYNGPPNNGCWFPLLFDPAVPVLLDAWGNPVICAMGGVLGNGRLATYGTPSSGTGYITAGGAPVQVLSPDLRLFFASAGPDSDFSKGDDNLYSFDFK